MTSCVNIVCACSKLSSVTVGMCDSSVVCVRDSRMSCESVHEIYMWFVANPSFSCESFRNSHENVRILMGFANTPFPLVLRSLCLYHTSFFNPNPTRMYVQMYCVIQVVAEPCKHCIEFSSTMRIVSKLCGVLCSGVFGVLSQNSSSKLGPSWRSFLFSVDPPFVVAAAVEKGIENFYLKLWKLAAMHRYLFGFGLAAQIHFSFMPTSKTQYGGYAGKNIDACWYAIYL